MKKYPAAAATAAHYTSRHRQHITELCNEATSTVRYRRSMSTQQHKAPGPLSLHCTLSLGMTVDGGANVIVTTAARGDNVRRVGDRGVERTRGEIAAEGEAAILRTSSTMETGCRIVYCTLENEDGDESVARELLEEWPLVVEPLPRSLLSSAVVADHGGSDTFISPLS